MKGPEQLGGEEQPVAQGPDKDHAPADQWTRMRKKVLTLFIQKQRAGHFGPTLDAKTYLERLSIDYNGFLAGLFDRLRH